MQIHNVLIGIDFFKPQEEGSSICKRPQLFICDKHTSLVTKLCTTENLFQAL